MTNSKIHPAFLVLSLFYLCQISPFFVPVSGQSIENQNFNLNTQKNSSSSLPICIVGSGLSGLGLGRILQKKGRLVKIFDERDHPGGKIQTFRQSDEIQVEMCPIVFGMWQTSLAPYVRQFNLHPVFFNTSDIGGFDGVTGHLFPEISMPTTLPELTVMGTAVLGYLFHRELADTHLKFGYVNTPQDLLEVSMETWMDQRNLGALKQLFRLALTMEGYGDLNVLPAIYGLKFIDRDLLLSKVLNLHSIVHLSDGLDVLANKLAEPLDIQLNRRATQIQRIKGQSQDQGQDQSYLILQTVDASTRGASDDEMSVSEQNCSKVILAFPPLLKSLEKICVDLTQEERDVLAHVKIQKFASAAMSIPNLKRKMYSQAAKSLNGRVEPFAHGEGEPTAFARQNFKKRQDIFSSFSWIRGDFDEGPSQEDLAQIDERLQKIIHEFDPKSEIIYRKHSEYFPHVNISSMRDGFFKKFDAIQGRGGLYYASTLLEIEHMDGALKTAEGMVRRFAL